MPVSLRLVLAVLGLGLCLLAASAVVYVLWPLETVRVQVTVEPTVFAPP